MLSLAECCRWWDHKARKWYYHSIQGEEEADGNDWSEILLLRSHWLGILQVVGSQGHEVVLPQHTVQGEEQADNHDWSEILLLFSNWLSILQVVGSQGKKEGLIGQKFCCSALNQYLHIACGGITSPESGTTTAYKERRRRAVVIGQKFCCFSLIG